MRPTETEQRREPARKPPPCPQICEDAVIQNLLAGLAPSESRIEALLDHLERGAR